MTPAVAIHGEHIRRHSKPIIVFIPKNIEIIGYKIIQVTNPHNCS
jgi:hypothetical protein